jgi:hypothetical protein
MTLVARRLEALVVARAHATRSALSLSELVQPLDRFSPGELTQAAWRDRLAEVASDLRARGVLEPGHRLHDGDELARRIGPHSAQSWPPLAERVLPALALGIPADDGKQQARLAGRDAWAAAIVGRSLGLWRDGPAPSLPALCDALTWRELGLAGKPKRCPPEIRALFVQRQLASDPGPPERLVRVLAAREVGAPRPELRALREALVRCWLAGKTIGAPGTATDEPVRTELTGGGSRAPATGDIPAASATQGGAGSSREAHDTSRAAGGDAAGLPLAAPGAAGSAAGNLGFADAVLSAAGAARDGWFGDRKVFVFAVWDELRKRSPWAAIALDDFKARLVAAHRAGELTLARADLVAAMDPALVAASEIAADGASFHFIVKEPPP